MTSISDFHIVGGGINGLLLARELAAAGARVTVIERTAFGREASWAGGGIVSPLYPWRYPAAITALASWAQDYYPVLCDALLAETGLDAELSGSGLLMLDAADRQEALEWARQHGRTMSELTAAQIHSREPGLAGGFSQGLWMPEVANVRNPRLLRALVASLELQSGVELLQDTEVTAWHGDKGKVSELDLMDTLSGKKSRLRVSQLVVCAGAWSGEFLRRTGITLGVHPVKGQMLLYRFERPPINSIVLTRGRYLIPRQDGHVLVGSTLEYENFDKAPSMEARESLRQSAISILPEIADLQPTAQWAGLRPGSDDGLPFIGALGDWRNVSVNAGQFRNGLVLAPASARLMADMLLGREPIVDPAPYAPGREIGNRV